MIEALSYTHKDFGNYFHAVCDLRMTETRSYPREHSKNHARMACKSVFQELPVFFHLCDFISPHPHPASRKNIMISPPQAENFEGFETIFQRNLTFQSAKTIKISPAAGSKCCFKIFFLRGFFILGFFMFSDFFFFPPTHLQDQKKKTSALNNEKLQ